MEFLIARGFHNAKETELKTALSYNVTFRDGKDIFVHVDDDFYLFSQGAPIRADVNPARLHIFDGNAFYKDSFLHTLLDNPPEEVEAIFDALEAGAMNDVSGVFCIARIDLASKQFELYCDPLSQYPIASWQSGERYVVSNNVFLIEQFLQSQGHQLERDPLCMLRNTIAVLNVSLTTAFKEVFYQPPRTVLKAGTKLVRQEVFSWHYLCSPPGTYKDCLEEAAERLKKKCNALINSMPGYYFRSDLTGGIDSRLVFAALLATGHAEKVEFWCNTRYPDPDANVADHIISRYKLRQGTSLLNYVDEGFTIAQSISRGLFRNRGARYKDWAGLGQGYFPKMVRLSGSFGEIGRSNVLTDLFNNPGFTTDDFKEKTIQRMERIGSLDLITEKGKHLIADPIQQMVTIMQEMGIPRDSMSDMLYLDGRGRYHFGHYFACNNGLHISPCLIYDLNIVWANILLNNEQRSAGKVQFDLIRMLGGDELIEVPLAGKRWASSLVSSDMKQKLEDVEIITGSSSALPTNGNTMKWRLGWPVSQGKIVKPKPRPAFARGRSLAWAQLPEYQSLAGNLLDQTDGSEDIFNYVHRENLRAFTLANPETVDKDWNVWALQSVVGGLMWALGKEDRTPISQEYKGDYPHTE